MKLSDHEHIRVFHKTVLIFDDVYDEKWNWIDRVDELYSEVATHGPTAYPFTSYHHAYKEGNVGSLVFDMWRRKISALNLDNQNAGFEIWTNALYNNGLHLHMDCDETSYVQSDVVRPPKWASTFYLGPKNALEGGELAICYKGFDYYADRSKQPYSKKDLIKGNVSHCMSDEECEEIRRDPDWLVIPFRYNRLIVFDPVYPHCVLNIKSGTTLDQPRVALSTAVWDKEVEIYQDPACPNHYN